MIMPPQRCLLALLFLFTACQSRNKNISEVMDICGSNDLQPVARAVAKAPWTSEQILKLEPSVVAIKEKTASSYYCSGFLIGEDLIMTAEHCVDWRRAKNLAVSFHYQLKADGSLDSGRDDFEVLQLVESGAPELDYAILRLKKNAAGQSAGQKYPILPLNFAAVAIGTDILVIQHPLGGPKRVDSGHVTGDAGARMLFNDLDAETGSSGSPIFNLKGEVIGVHTHGGCKARQGANKGFRLSEIHRLSPFLNPSVSIPLAGSLPAAIPDADARGLRFEKQMPDQGPVRNLTVSFKVDHPYFEDLSLLLLSPTGKMLTLRDRASDGQLGLTSMSFPPREPLDSFAIMQGEPSGGTWQLLAIDRRQGREGKLLEWELKLNTEP